MCAVGYKTPIIDSTPSYAMTVAGLSPQRPESRGTIPQRLFGGVSFQNGSSANVGLPVFTFINRASIIIIIHGIQIVVNLFACISSLKSVFYR